MVKLSQDMEMLREELACRVEAWDDDFGIAYSDFKSCHFVLIVGVVGHWRHASKHLWRTIVLINCLFLFLITLYFLFCMFNLIIGFVDMFDILNFHFNSTNVTLFHLNLRRTCRIIILNVQLLLEWARRI
jgi:hypothetical protein